MLLYFMLNPWHYWIPLGVNLVVLILVARFLGPKLKGEWRLFREPVIVLGGAFMWPLLDMGLIITALGWVGAKIIGFLIGYKGR